MRALLSAFRRTGHFHVRLARIYLSPSCVRSADNRHNHRSSFVLASVDQPHGFGPGSDQSLSSSWCRWTQQKRGPVGATLIQDTTSEQRSARQFGEYFRELFLKAGIRHFCSGRLPLAVIPVSPTRRRGGIVADREPGLREMSHLEIIRRSGAAHLGRYPTRINSVAQNIRPAPSDCEGERCDVELAF